MAETTTQPTETIVPRVIEEEMKTSYLDYSMSVIVGRALPDIRDGLKPVHRRVLYGMYELNSTHNKPFKKSARIVGEVMGKYHPHGDAAIYDTLVRLAQNFAVRYPLVQGQGNFGCFTKDTKVRLADGRSLSFGELAEEHKQGKKNFTFTVKKDGTISIAEIIHPRLTKQKAPLVNVILDNGEEITCTPDHRFMLIDGQYREAQHLTPGTSLMPGYFRLTTKKESPETAGYELIYQPKTQTWSFAHHLADEWNLAHNIYPKSAGRVRHHADFNKLNNNPTNILRMHWGAHLKLHSQHASILHTKEEYRSKIAQGRKQFWDSTDVRTRYAERMTARNKEKWQNPEYREHMRQFLSDINKKYIEQHPEKRTEHSIRATATLKRLWKDPYYRARFHEKIVAVNKNRITNNTGKAKFLRICHETLAEYRTLTKETYEATRKSQFGTGFTTWETGIRKYFSNDIKAVYAEVCQNHKVSQVEFLTETADVYDLTVQHTNNFLLAAGIFVHNSVDGDAAAAMRYCVTKDTLVTTEKGLIPIGELAQQENINLHILSTDQKINLASKWFDSGEHPTLKLITNKGYTIQGSHNHPLLTLTTTETGKPTFSWKLLEHIKTGDIVVLDRSDALFPTKQLPLTPYYPTQRTHRTTIRTLPQYLTEDLAFIMGALIAEGTITQNKIEFCNTDTDFLREFEKRWLTTFPDSTLHKFARKPSSFGKKPYWILECHCRFTIDFLKNIGVTPVKSRGKSIPFSILQSPKKVAAAFIQSYFEGDGSISFAKKMVELSCCSVSPTLIEVLQTLFLRFGIDTFRRYDPHRLIHKLYTRGARNILKFYSQIGFAAPIKNKKLEHVILTYQKDTSLTDYVPFISDFIRRFTGSSGFSARHNFDRYGSMERNYLQVCQEVKQATKQEYTGLFEYLLTYNYLFEPVMLVEPAGIASVYSIKVESNCHSFIANGFINHNTEARLNKIAEEMLQDIEKETVSFTPNFDGSLKEPTVLPSKVPNLLLNGSAGIAVGMATNIPPHNLRELTETTINYINNPNLTVQELMRTLPAPDFPTGGIICGTEGIKQAYETGRGKIILRARHHIEEAKNKNKIIITEIPYQVNKAQLVEQIADLVRDKKISGITDLRDESDREGLRIVIELKQGTNTEVLLNQLFSHTRLQETFGIINLALVNNQPRILTLPDMLSHFIEHRQEVVRKRTAYDLQEAEKKAHLLEGLIIALNNIDAIVSLIKKARSTETAKQALITDYKLSTEQAQAILDMRLARLTSLEQEKIKEDHKNLLVQIADFKDILASEQRIKDIIKNELMDLSSRFGDSRHSMIQEAPASIIDQEALIKPEDVVVTLSHQGYLKRLPVDTYKQQRRGGKGIIAAETKEEDYIENLFVANTHDKLLCFTNLGKVHWVRVFEIPEAGRYARGSNIANILNLAPEEHTTTYLTVKDFTPDTYILFVTKKGIVKKTTLDAYSNQRKGGIAAIGLDEGDELINTLITNGKAHLILATKNGLAIRFSEEDVRPMGRTAGGVIGIRLRDDEVIDAVVADETKTLLTITEGGYGKRTPVADYRLIGRGGVGVINVKLTGKNKNVVAVKPVSDEDEIMLITKQGIMIRISAKDISIVGRNSQGVRVMKLEQNDSVVACTTVKEE